MKRSGRIIADSAESYSSRAKMVKTLNNLVNSFEDGNYEIIEPE